MGKFTISLDFELGWGGMESQMWRYREKKGVFKNFRSVIERMTALLDDLEISLTWACVGAMVSNPEPSDFDHLPEPFRQNAVDFLKGSETFTHDGRDLLENLLKMRTKQDIGSHSFSHTRFHIDSFSDEAKLLDLKKGREALLSFDIEPKSFVYPVNQVSNLELLAEAGFSVARLPPKTPSSRGGKLTEAILGRTPSAKRHQVSQKFETEDGSMLYNWRNSRFRRALIDHQVRLGLQKISHADYHLHLWLHPFNLVEIDGLENGLYELLKKAAHLRDKGRLQICTMS